MKISIRFDRPLSQSASEYYDKAKKAKKKLAGLQSALKQMEKKIGAETEKNNDAALADGPKKKRNKKWFEKFHWFYSSDGFLVISGRDAKSNENLVKKHMDKTDQYFHAEIFGAPHTVIKAGQKEPPKETMKEAAQFAAIFSRAWKQKLSAVDVYSVKPGQVSKSAPSGESIGKGAFMIYGKRDWYKKTPLEFAIGVNAEGQVISGPKSAVQKHATTSTEILQGEETTGNTAKKIKKELEHKTGFALSLDEIISMLPAGGVKMRKNPSQND